MEPEVTTPERLTRGETVTALAHYYRGEVTRSLMWRERLDRTTNWAVGATAAFLGFAFSDPEINHGLFIFALATVYTLLFVEARRYRFFDAYEYRVRLMHQYFFYGILTGTTDLAEDSFWVAELASDLRYPQYKMSSLYALGRRFKANYGYLFTILLAAWLYKIALHPAPAHSWDQFVAQASLVGLPGWGTLLFMILFVVHEAVLLHIGNKPLGGRDIFASERHGGEQRPDQG